MTSNSQHSCRYHAKQKQKQCLHVLQRVVAISEPKLYENGATSNAAVLQQAHEMEWK